MTPLETLILATYFFILIILAGYGWHRYYLVYSYMKNRDKVPVPVNRFDELPVVPEEADACERRADRGKPRGADIAKRGDGEEGAQLD